MPTWIVDGRIFIDQHQAIALAHTLSRAYKDREFIVTSAESGCAYFKYLNGRCILDGWTVK